MIPFNDTVRWEILISTGPCGEVLEKGGDVFELLLDIT